MSSHPTHLLHHFPKSRTKRLVTSISSIYTRNFDKNPNLTLFVTNGGLNTLGDACAQFIPLFMGLSPTFDPSRSLRFLLYGGSIGPLIGKWNHFLEHRFPLRALPSTMVQPRSLWHTEREFRREQERNWKWGEEEYFDEEDARRESKTQDKVPPVSKAMLFKRVICDQLLMAPFGIFLFISSMSLMEGLDFEEYKQRFRDTFFKILTTNWAVWPLLQLINFRYLPLRYRVPYSASMGVLWTVYISFVNGQAKSHEESDNKIKDSEHKNKGRKMIESPVPRESMEVHHGHV